MIPDMKDVVIQARDVHKPSASWKSSRVFPWKCTAAKWWC